MLVGEVPSVMKSLANEGATMVIVTHEMEFARQVANRIVFMDGGQVGSRRRRRNSSSARPSRRAQQFLARFHVSIMARAAERGPRPRSRRPRKGSLPCAPSWAARIEALRLTVVRIPVDGLAPLVLTVTARGSLN